MNKFAEYIGLEYHRTKFNCWHFFRQIQKECFGINVPEIPLDAENLRGVAQAFGQSPERKKWTRIEQPQHGCCVLLKRAKMPIHIGVWLDIDGGGIIHCIKGLGVVFQKRANLNGWTIEGYYAYA